MDAYDLAGSFMKVGRKYNRWVSRWYVLRNRVMYIYESKGQSHPKHILYLRGLYFEKTRGKDGLFGIRIFSDTSGPLSGDTMRFKERYMFHRDVKEVDKWMVFLSQHCHYFQAEEILQLGKKLGDGAFGAVYEAKHSYSD